MPAAKKKAKKVVKRGGSRKKVAAPNKTRAKVLKTSIKEQLTKPLDNEEVKAVFEEEEHDYECENLDHDTHEEFQIEDDNEDDDGKLI